MGINSREDANKYYQIINDLLDDYTDKHKIRPSNLKKYLKPGSDRFNKFIAKNGLKDINGSELILKDILDDRYNMEKDGVIKFESFKLFESDEFKTHSLKQCLYKGIDKSTTQMEKVLADHFDTSLSHIDVINSDKHSFKIENWNGENIEVVIYSQEDIDIIIENIISYLYDELCEKEIDIIPNVKIKLKDFKNLIDIDSFSKNIKDNLSDEFIFNDLIGNSLGDSFKYEKSQKFHLWVKTQ